MSTMLTPTIQAATMGTPIGPLTVLASDGRVCAAGFTDSVELVASFRPRSLRITPIEAVGDLGSITDALASYFFGDMRALDRIPILVQGGPFQERVWAALREIPAGEPTTYGALAVKFGGQRLARAVGGANATNPCAPIVPCHRLVGSDGKLTGYYWGLDRKQWLLDHERRHTHGG